MATIDQDRLEPGLWVIDVLDTVHERMLLNGDHEGLRRLARLNDEELIHLAHNEIDTWSTTP